MRDAAFAADADRAGWTRPSPPCSRPSGSASASAGWRRAPSSRSPKPCSRTAPSSTSSCPPTRPASPRASSTRMARDWRARFDAALEAAESVELVRPLQAPPDARMAALAGEVARGAAMLNAERLMSEAVLLRIGADADAPTGLRTHVLAPPAGAVARTRGGAAGRIARGPVRLARGQRRQRRRRGLRGPARGRQGGARAERRRRASRRISAAIRSSSAMTGRWRRRRRRAPSTPPCARACRCASPAITA